MLVCTYYRFRRVLINKKFIINEFRIMHEMNSLWALPVYVTGGVGDTAGVI